MRLDATLIFHAWKQGKAFQLGMSAVANLAEGFQSLILRMWHRMGRSALTVRAKARQGMGAIARSPKHR